MKKTTIKSIITNLMGKTFHKSRQVILQGIAIEDIMKSYHAFKYTQVVSSTVSFEIVRKQQYLMNKLENLGTKQIYII